MRVAKLEMGNNFHKSGSTRIIPAPRSRLVPCHVSVPCAVPCAMPRFVPSPCAAPIASAVSCAALPPCASATQRRGPVPCTEPVPPPPPPPLYTRLMAS